MNADELNKSLAGALADAHLPALLVTLVHITGDEGLLREDWRPKYKPYADNRTGGLAPAAQDGLRSLARDVILRLFANGNEARISCMPRSALHRMMEFVAGAAVPQRYIPLLQDELGIDENGAPADSVPTLHKDVSKQKVVVVGGGMSGLLAAIRLKQSGIPFELIERNADVGGTWFENTYPGCRVDSQNHIYSYSFAPNHDWPHHFSTQDALLRYFKGCVEKFGLAENIRVNTSVDEAIFDEGTNTWRVRLRTASGAVEDITADVVISAVGQLNKPNIPEYEGRESFVGPQFHSARWRHDVDLQDKNIAVVGTGASAYQIAPAVAKQARHLDIFQRSAPWMAPSPDYHFEVGEGQKWLLHTLPGYASWYRFWLFWTITDGVYESVKVDPAWRDPDGSISAANQSLRNTLVSRMVAQIGERADLIDKVIPKFPFGGKRTLRDSGEWIPMLKRENVELVTGNIARITPHGIVTDDGIEHRADVIIYGTGFHATRFLEPMRVVGCGGVELTQRWAGNARAYLGMTVPGYPNFFCIYGPNTNLVVNGSIVFFSECSMNYILGCLDLLARKGAASMEPRIDIHDAYNDRVDAGNGRMAWGVQRVSNWYKNAQGRVTQNWPFPLVEYWESTRSPNPDDFIFHRNQTPQRKLHDPIFHDR